MKIKAFVFALLFAFAGISFAGNSLKMQVPGAITDSLPWFAVREIRDGNNPFTLTKLAKLAEQNNRVALVYFATWCVPCRAGVARLAKNQELLNKKGVAVVLVNIGERDEKAIKSWIKKVGADGFLAISDPFKRMTEGFGFVKEGEDITLPRTLVVDKKAHPLFVVGEEGDNWPSVLWE